MAEFWLRKATTLAPGGKDVDAATLFQKVRVKRTYGPLTQDYAVKVDFTEYGRAVFATDQLEEGGYSSSLSLRLTISTHYHTIPH